MIHPQGLKSSLKERLIAALRHPKPESFRILWSRDLIQIRSFFFPSAVLSKVA
jgi:hypothetical protein